jgi:hypothetical protein
MYDLATGCEGERKLRLVGLNNQHKVINPQCTEWFGGFADGSHESTFNAISGDGSEIFFTAFVEPHASHPGCGPSVTPSASDPAQVFMRLDGFRTVEISRPFPSKCVEVPCENSASRSPALFWGASEDGSKVFFTTSAPLVGEDKDTSNDLYMAVVGCPEGQECEPAQRDVTSLVDVSHSHSGEASEVQGVVKIAADGSRVYFVARGVLTEGPNAEGRAPVKGADNLYVFDGVTGKVTFVADLCSGPSVSGMVESTHCPADLEAEGPVKERNDANLWLVGGSEHEAQIAGPAEEASRFLVFSTFAQLITRGTGADTDDAKDVYRYDAATGSLVRVSVGESGHDANGNCDDGTSVNVCNAKLTMSHLTPLSEHAQHGFETRAIAENGSPIIFESAEPLSPTASNGLENVYEWRETENGAGNASLISTGSAPEPEEDAVMSSSGSDVFFVTLQGLLSQDTDGQADVCDARVGGGFPAPVVGEEQCSGEACKGPLSNPAPLLVPGSVVQAAGGNFVAQTPKAKTSTKAKKKAVKGKTEKKSRSKGRAKKARKAKHKAGRASNNGSDLGGASNER